MYDISATLCSVKLNVHQTFLSTAPYFNAILITILISCWSQLVWNDDDDYSDWWWLQWLMMRTMTFDFEYYDYDWWWLLLLWLIVTITNDDFMWLGDWWLWLLILFLKYKAVKFTTGISNLSLPLCRQSWTILWQQRGREKLKRSFEKWRMWSRTWCQIEWQWSLLYKHMQAQRQCHVQVLNYYEVLTYEGQEIAYMLWVFQHSLHALIQVRIFYD